MAWVATAVTAGTAIYGAINSKKAADKSAAQVSNLQYQPIDLKALQEQARTTAEANARNSKALEAELNPDLAAARAGSQKQVASNLALGGNLSPDVANAVTSASEAQANSAGLYGGAGPIRCDLAEQRGKPVRASEDGCHQRGKPVHHERQ